MSGVGAFGLAVGSAANWRAGARRGLEAVFSLPVTAFDNSTEDTAGVTAAGIVGLGSATAVAGGAATTGTAA